MAELAEAPSSVLPRRQRQDHNTYARVPASSNPSSRMPTSLTIYGHVDTRLEDTIRTLQQNNVKIVIREESAMLRILNENRMKEMENHCIGEGTKKDVQCTKKGKENQCPYMSTPSSAESIEGLSSRYTLAQRNVYVNSNSAKRKSQQLTIFPGSTSKRASGDNKTFLMQPVPFSLDSDFDEIAPTCNITSPDHISVHGAQSQQHCQSQPNHVCDRLGLGEMHIVQSLPDSIMLQQIQVPSPGITSFDPRTNSTPRYIDTNNAIVSYPTTTNFGVLPLRYPARNNLGKMDKQCPHCLALHWEGARLVGSNKQRYFGTCCLSGKVRLPGLLTPPPEIMALFDGNDERAISFRGNIRAYNAANAFTSLGVQIDDSMLPGVGPKPFTIHGQLRHRTGSLREQPGQDPVYAQLYIHDPHEALNIRTRRNPQLQHDVLQIIQDCLGRNNVFAAKYRQTAAILESLNADSHELPAYLHFSAIKDQRRYNLPTVDEIALILPGDGTETSMMRDIIVRLKGSNALMQISECHPAYLPLHYVLFFPYGELGWDPDLKQWNPISGNWANTRLTQLQFYCYRIFQRPTEYSTILRGGKLFQEFIVDAWAATEQNRLTYYRLNQGKLRAELYSCLTDIADNGFDPDQVGKRIVLPSSFTGSPRHMFEIFQDSMAITRFNHHPDIFLTMTANPKWQEITEALLPNQDATDRPDLVARVFELKRKALMKELDVNKVFGLMVAYVFTIEYQKRGLPHMHLLIYLHGPDKIKTCAQVDKLICAEFPNEVEDPELYYTIKRCMVHGPCGVRNPNAPCMDGGKCSKGYPKQFTENTRMDRDGYPIYRRRHDSVKHMTNKGHEIDNRDVVPYNAYLSRLLDCHINVEVCAGIICVKYIHKYIYKGHDRTTLVLGGADEIKQYLDARYIGPVEAAWRLFGYPMHAEFPNVVRLALHLPGMHIVVYDPEEQMNHIVARAANQMTTLTGFFACCALYEDARQYTYQDFPQHFVWKKLQKVWTPRKKGRAIGRIYFASPNEGERFYLRLLLTVVKGPQSFESLRTVNDIIHPTFKAACVARGLLEDDEEWKQCLLEASVMRTGTQLRSLFSVILTQCSPQNPNALWTQFWMHICDDLPYRLQTQYRIPQPSDSEIEDYGLYLLNQLLQESGKSLKDFPPMPLPTRSWNNNIVGNRLISEQLELQTTAMNANVDVDIDKLNVGQRSSFDAIYNSVLNNSGTIFFLNGGAGTGKTFLYNTVATKCRSQGHIVVSVASSGIASLLLVGGRTAHSTFKIPLDVLENSICGFNKQSEQAELFRQTKLIIWDEVTMQHRYCVEAVDRSLQDICGNDKHFGGITIVLGGDFRQILPVIPKGVREQIVSASLKRSVLWRCVQMLSLTENMRLDRVENRQTIWADFLMEIGSNPNEIVQLPTTINRCPSINDLINVVYPHLDNKDTVTPEFLNERAILSARNDDVSDINARALNVYPGEMFSYLAADKMCDDEGIDITVTNRYPNEFLNSLNPSGLPPFQLDLKVGCPIMLLRNIAPKDGLCNGTRLIVEKCSTFVIEARILTGDKFGNLAFIPRISLTPSSSEIPIRFSRRQFPIRGAFAMTINKSQGQSVKFVGLDLRTPVFSHGQLYVALSRCTSSDRINLLLSPEDIDTTTNIVYPEILL